ncbi:MAG TPA: hypothetical protein VFX43_07850 [Chitinophagaceae bacterium]|nr:hypothetical protein [Chitinophagaceae bacterium]
MKLLPPLMVTVFCCVAISCGHKDDSAKPSAQIIGKWNANKIYLTSYRGDQLIERDTTFVTTPDYYTIEFKPGNTVAINTSIQGSEDHQSAYYKIQGDQILLGGTADDPDKETFDYVLKEHSLELSVTENDTLNNQVLTMEEHIFFEKAP